MSENKTINGSDYHRHSGLWVPEDLQAGDIIRCKMMTKHRDVDQAEMCSRNVMVLGMEMEPDTLEYTSIHVARFSYNPTYCTDDTNFLIPRYLERRGLITGLTEQATLKADRTDFVPLTQDHFWSDVYDVQRIGKVDRSLFAEIRETMERGHRIAGSQSRLPPRNTKKWYVAGAHLAGEDVPSPHHKHEFTALDEIDVARIQADWALRKDPNKLEAKFVTKCLANIERARIALARQANWEARHKKGESVHPPRNKTIFAESAGTARSQNNDTAVAYPLSPDERFTMLLPHAGVSKLNDLRELAVHFKNQADTNFFKIELPKHLWQGRYMMVKTPDLHDEENDGTSYRPCVVWKAYADRDTGKLTGLELHPVTRGSLNTFRYRFQVYPLHTDSRRPGHLIADCIVRVPLTERYFHDQNHQPFFELPPDKLEKFKERREHALNSGDPVHVYGLKDIPDNWVEIALDPTPSFQQFMKWSESGKIQFDGAMNDRARQRQREHKHPHFRREI